ncbi:hypothetical protein CRM22_003253 [Opisthorchis felineus]|uniref:Ribosomal protein S14 n=1 Tax=Opisthorchis felineus TaxID=147828 RepID=A0A4S2M269_OPIFE|nr:hypothetical protein CRM22_003253 [Opisthorchis felineus]
MQNLRSLFATPKYLGASLSQLSTHIRYLTLFPKIPSSIIVQHQTIPTKTPEHHSNPEVERLLETQLCGFPPYEARKLRPGFQDAIMKRDYLKREVSAHFSDLRLRLNAIRKNNILPRETRDMASLQIASLPRDSNWTRIKARCVITSRRRGCKMPWRISRIVWRRYADYNKMSGALWGAWSSNTRSVRKHMSWPPPKGHSVGEYLKRYHQYLADE